MRFNLLKTNLIGVLGLPRSGTTIISNILDSCNNGFCVIEPIWASHMGYHNITTNKFGHLTLNPTSDIINNLRNIISEKMFDFGSIKETFRCHQKFCAEPIMSSCDNLIVTFRNPVDNFSSWKRTRWGGIYDKVEYFNDCYRTLFRFSHTPKVSVIVHEYLCAKKLQYFNYCIKQIGSIDDLLLKGIESPLCMGDGKASQSKNIELQKSENCLTAYERVKIQPSIRHYEDLKSRLNLPHG